MVNVIQPQNRTSVTLNVDSGEIVGGDSVPNSLEQLAEQTGIVGAINNVNQESRQTDQDLREDYNIYADSPEGHNHPQPQDEHEYRDSEQQYDEPEQTPKKRAPKKKNKTADQRIRELSYQNLQTQHEKEALELELKRTRDEHAASLLSFEKQRITNDINRVSDIMVQAKDEDETKTYVDANRVLHTLIHKESEADAALTALQQSYHEQSESYDYKQEEQRFLQLSDPKELNSNAYSDWLRENPYYNPYDAENYDADLSDDVHQIKRNFNKFLKTKRQGNFIGTDDYYNELTNIINVKLFGDYNTPYQQQEDHEMATRHTVHIDPQYDQSLQGAVPEGHHRTHGHYPEPDQYVPPQPPQRAQPQPQQQYPYHAPRHVAPVNRAGYSSQYSSNNIPVLDPTQRKLALSIPMYDTQSRPLSDSERLHVYAQGLAEMNRR